MLDELRSQIGHSVRNLWARPAPEPAKPRRVAAAAPAAAASKSAPVAAPLTGEALRRQQMQQALFQLIEQHAATRQFMRPLGLVERTLRKQGFDAVAALPPSVIQQALAQLEQLVADWSRPGLAEIRMRLQVMGDDRSNAAQAFEPTAPAALPMFATPQEAGESGFDTSVSAPARPAAERVAPAMRTPIAPTAMFCVATTTPETSEVDELSDKDRAAFEEMERSWAGRLPDGMAEAIAAARRGG